MEQRQLASSPVPEGETRKVRVGREVHLNVLLLAKRALEQLEEICKSEGVTHSQYVALWRLCLSPEGETGIALKEVSDGMISRASDNTRLVDRLERAGLVERMANPTDRRGVLVRPTPEGRRRFEAVTPKLQAFHADQWSNLTAAETEELRSLLQKAMWGDETWGGPPPK